MLGEGGEGGKGEELRWGQRERREGGERGGGERGRGEGGREEGEEGEGERGGDRRAGMRNESVESGEEDQWRGQRSINNPSQFCC